MTDPIDVKIHLAIADGQEVQPTARAQGDFLALRVSFERLLELHLTTSEDALFVVGMHPSGATGWNYPLPQPLVSAGDRYVLPIVIPPGSDGAPFDGEVWLAARPTNTERVALPTDPGLPSVEDEGG